VEQACGEPCCFQMVLHKPRDIGLVFQYKYGLAQTVCPRPAAVWVVVRQPLGTMNRVMQPDE